MKYFLVVFNRATGKRVMTEFDDLSAATAARLQQDRLNSDPGLEIVVIGSKSLENLQITHSRYFRSDELPDISEWLQSAAV